MTALVLSLTNAGLAAVQGASGSDPVVIAELGLTATPFTAAPTLTALPGEFKRIAAISGTAAAANVTHMTAYDTSGDAWNATGMGLWLGDGTLFAVYSSASTIINKASPAFALISFDIAFSADLASSIAFGDPLFTNPPATTTTRGLVELATGLETFTGTDNQRAITPEALGLALLDMIKARDGTGSGIDADLLDGQHGAYYFDDAAAVLAKLATVDGAGSGLDADLLDGQQASRLAPAGIIVMWSGSVASVPTGWALCDGANGTPDLRNRFIVGAGSTYAPANTGGATEHQHSIEVQPAATGLSINTTTATVNADGDPPSALTSATLTDPTHVHTATSGLASSLPPYFALAFIMKL